MQDRVSGPAATLAGRRVRLPLRRLRLGRPAAVWVVAVVAATAALPPAGLGETAATFDCVMDPSSVAQLGSPVVGLLREVMVKRGETVAEGQVIARIEADVEAATVTLARARANSDAEIEAQQARLDLSRKRLDRSSRLTAGNVVSEQRMDELVAEVEVAERELTQARLRKGLAELELSRAQVLLEQRTIRSPLTGIVTERHLSAGEYVHQEGHIVTVAGLDPLHVEAFLPVELYGRIIIGSLATVRPNAPVGGAYAARVTVVDRVFDPASGTFGVRLELPNPDQALPAGLRCQVTFQPAP